MDELLSAIGTDAANELNDYLHQDWDEVERPQFEHPSRQTLWLVNDLLTKLRKLKADPEVKSVFFRHIEMYENELRTLATNLLSTDHSVAFVGSKGVGKSTAISIMLDLRVAAEGPLNKQMVLEAGAGGTTICEIHVKEGPQFGLIVEPRTNEAIRYDVADFVEYLLRIVKADQRNCDKETDDGPGISKEINRAIRNMTELAEPKTKDPTTGRLVRHDPARILAAKYPNPKELVVQLLSLMDLTRRDQRDIWYPGDTKVKQLEWLQETFMKINNCRLKQFSLPQRIEVVIPGPVLDDKQLRIRIIDTRGIDGAATRADLDRLFEDPRTFVVLCSRFNDAPENALQQLLQRVKDAGARSIAEKTLVLVLPRPEEAIAVKDNSGILVEDEVEGYDLKRGDVEMTLSRLCLQAVPVEFFNARCDDPIPLRGTIVSGVRGIRLAWENRVHALSKTVDDLIANQKQEQTAIIFREVRSHLNSWLSKNRDIDTIAEEVQQELVMDIRQAHWRSVWASVRRRGEWWNLDYYYEIGHGAKTIAAKYVAKKASEFEVIIQNLLNNPDLAAAYDMLEQVKLVLRARSDEMLKKMEIVGKAAFEDDLRADTAFWDTLEGESGQGYRDRIATNSDDWFKINDRSDKHAFVKEKIVEGWQQVLAELDALLGDAPEH